MADFIIHRPMPDAFAPHLREAIDFLGYVRSDAFEELLAMYRAQWPRGVSKAMFSRAEIEQLLTDKGLVDWRHAQVAIFLRATFNFRREEASAKEVHWAQFASKVCFVAQAEWLCQRARDLDGTLVDRTERWPLPMAGCIQEWCPCRWLPIPD